MSDHARVIDRGRAIRALEKLNRPPRCDARGVPLASTDGPPLRYTSLMMVSGKPRGVYWMPSIRASRTRRAPYACIFLHQTAQACSEETFVARVGIAPVRAAWLYEHSRGS